MESLSRMEGILRHTLCLIPEKLRYLEDALAPYGATGFRVSGLGFRDYKVLVTRVLALIIGAVGCNR